MHAIGGVRYHLEDMGGQGMGTFRSYHRFSAVQTIEKLFIQDLACPFSVSASEPTL